MRTKIVGLGLAVLVSVQAQVWVARFDGAGHGNDGPAAIATDQENSVVIAGYSSRGGLLYDYLVLKYDSTGQEQWHDVISAGGSSMNTARDLAVDRDGNVYATGSVQPGLNCFCTTKHNPAGARVYVRYYSLPGGGSALGRAVACDDSGNAYATGNAQDEFGDAWWVTLRYSPTGSLDWTAAYPCSSRLGGIPTGIAVGRQGDVYVTGMAVLGSGWTFLVLKYSPTGVLLWQARYQERGCREMYASCLDTLDNVYISGSSDSGYTTVKFAADSTREWVRHYRAFTDQPWAASCDRAGNVYVTGWSATAQGEPLDFCTVKYLSDGTERWVRRYSGPNEYGDRAFGLGLDSRANVYVTGSSNNECYSTVKYDSAGNELWVAQWSQPGATSSALCLAVDGEDCCVVSGCAYGTGDDIVTIKYDSTGQVGVTEASHQGRAHRLRAWPNPFRTRLTIELDGSLGPVVVSDASGRVVRTLQTEPGARTVCWDRRDGSGVRVEPGVYFVRLRGYGRALKVVAAGI